MLLVFTYQSTKTYSVRRIEARDFIFSEYIEKDVVLCVLAKGGKHNEYENMKQSGRRTRHIQKVNKITLEQLTETIDISAPYISKIKNE